MSDKGARLIALPYLDPERRLELAAPAGSTVREIVDLALAGATLEQRAVARVTIGDTVIPESWWDRIRPKSLATVIVRSLPGNSSLLRSALTISVAIAAMALGQLYAGPMAAGALGLAEGTAAFTGTVGLVSGALVTAGSLLVNALVPARGPSSAGSQTLPNYSIQGFKNGANADAPIPCILGKIRFAPPYLALPYTTAILNYNYVTAAFNFGYGPLVISTERIGDTDIAKYYGVTRETRQGYAGDAPLTLYTHQVIEDRLSIELSSVREALLPDIRATAGYVTSASIDVTFPGGLTNFFQMGNPPQTRQRPMAITIQVSYWLESTPGTVTTIPWVIVDMTSKAFTRTLPLSFPTRGRYIIQVNRSAPDYDDWDQTVLQQQIISRCYWSAIRSFRPEYPVNFNEPLAVAAVNVMATGQLNGVLDNYNAYASRICLDWDQPTQAWVTRETNNPASLFRYVLQSPAFAYPVADSEIDLAGLQYWHEFCAARGLAYNRVHDFDATVWDVLADIAAAGRATPQDMGDKWGVALDEIKTTVIAHISPRNSWDFSVTRSYVKFPDAFRVKFQDETSLYGFTEAERIIPWPGFVGDPAITESIDLPGITNPDLIWKETRWRQYGLIYRRDEYSVMMDFESIVFRRGDLVRLSHDILDRTQMATRVKAISGNIVVLDDLVTMVEGSSYAVRFRTLPATDGVPDISNLRTVQTVAGETDSIILTGAGTLPNVGDLAFFGLLGSESFECIVKNIEAGTDLTRRITLVDHAPQIQTLADAEVPPAWDGIVGAPIGDPTLAPPVPVLGTIISGLAVGPEPPIQVLVPVAVGGPVPATQTIEVDYRLHGTSTWTILTFPVSQGSAIFSGFSKGDVIDVQARAIGYGSIPLASSFTSVVTHTVAQTDDPPMFKFNSARNSQYAPMVG